MSDFARQNESPPSHAVRQPDSSERIHPGGHVFLAGTGVGLVAATLRLRNLCVCANPSNDEKRRATRLNDVVGQEAICYNGM